MKRKVKTKECKQPCNTGKRPVIGWNEFSLILSRQGVNEGTIESGTTRLTVPVSYSDPEDGFDGALNEAWFMTYAGPRRLVAGPLQLKAEYLDRQKAELCVETGISSKAFEILYVQEAQIVRLDCRRRWAIPPRLFAFLEIGVKRAVVLRPGVAWINIIPKDVDDQDLNLAIREVGIPPSSSGALG